MVVYQIWKKKAIGSYLPFVQLGLSEYLGRNILSLESLSWFDTLSQMENWLTNVLTGIIDLKEKGRAGKRM